MDDIISANEACNWSSKVLEDEFMEKIKFIREAIHEAVEVGEFEALPNGDKDDMIITYLENRGYKVVWMKRCGSSSGFYKITWDKPNGVSD